MIDFVLSPGKVKITDWKMEGPQKMVPLGEVNIISYCALGSAPCRPVSNDCLALSFQLILALNDLVTS